MDVSLVVDESLVVDVSLITDVLLIVEVSLDVNALDVTFAVPVPTEETEAV